MKSSAIIIAILCSTQVSFAKLSVLKKIENLNPSSFSCYSEESEKTGSTSSINFYVGAYSVDTDGNKTFNYYTGTTGHYTSAALCNRLQMIYSTVDISTAYEKFAVSILVDENNRLVGIEDFANKKLILVTE